MAISYPITPPTSPLHSSIKWIENNIVGFSQNPYTLQQTVFEYDGSGWQIEVSFDSMVRDDFEPWSVFLSKLHGPLGRFYYGDHLRRTIRGAGGGTPLVKGAAQTEFTLLTDGWPNSTAILKEGDMFSINYSLYKCLTNVTSDGSGNATIEVWPRLRNHADNSPIVVASPVGIFRLAQQRVETIEDRNQLYRLSFAAIEAL